MKKLVAYFSATGTTANVAEKIAQILNADLFEIKPKEKYTSSDLNWRDKNSRTTKECDNPSFRPEIDEKVKNFDRYDTVFIGFPIWWYKEPNIIDTFFESYDFSGKKIVLFATSGGSGLGKTVDDLKKVLAKTAKILDGKVLNFTSANEIKSWIANLDI